MSTFELNGKGDRESKWFIQMEIMKLQNEKEKYFLKNAYPPNYVNDENFMLYSGQIQRNYQVLRYYDDQIKIRMICL